MLAHNARNAYLQAKVQPETDPKRLILMLYEGALENIRLAREGIEEHNAAKRGEHLSRAVAIVSELYTALDPTVTDESIDFLRGLYQAMLVELAQVAVAHDAQVLDLAYRYLEALKQIWEHDVMGLKSQAATSEQRSAVQTSPSTSTTNPAAHAYGTSLVFGQRTFSV